MPPGRVGDAARRSSAGDAELQSHGHGAGDVGRLRARRPRRRATVLALATPTRVTPSPSRRATTQTSARAVARRHRHTRCPGGRALIGQRGQAGVVDDEHHGARRASRISALASTIRVLGPEPLQVHGADGGDHGDVGADPRAQVGDLARAVGAHLGHEDLGAVGQVLVHGPGQPGPVVEAGRAGHHGAAGRPTRWAT